MSVTESSGIRSNLYNAYQSTSQTESTDTTTVWNAVFADENKGVTMDDFLSMMVAQLKNQDFMNPVDDAQFVTQLAQFATMQQMQEIGANMKNAYALSLVGKEVTAAKFTVSGALLTERGMLERVSLVNNEYALYVNGQQFSMAQIMEIHGASESQAGGAE